MIYANSGPFREGLLRMIGQSTGAKPELKTFRMNPRTANAGYLALNWPEGNLLQDFKLWRLRAHISPVSFLGKSMTGEEVSIDEGTLSLQLPKPGQVSRFSPLTSGDLPVQFKRYRIPAFTMNLAVKEKSILTLYKSEASFTQEAVSGLPQMQLFRGDLSIPVPGWPRFRLNRALIEFRGDDIDVVGLRLMDETDELGFMGFSGTISPYRPEQVSNLTVTLDSFLISGLTSPAFAKLMSGRINKISSTTSNYFSFKPEENSSPALDITFGVAPSSQIVMQGFPFMFGISQLIEEGDNWFQTPVFDSDASGVIHKENGVTTFSDLNFVSKSRMAITGSLSLTSNQLLAGNLRVGMAAAMISKQSALNAMFGPPQDGFRWIELKISGSVNAPADNFKELYDESRKPKDTPATGTSEGGSTFEELTRPR